jgi:hypothetical protein
MSESKFVPDMPDICRIQRRSAAPIDTDVQLYKLLCCSETNIKPVGISVGNWHFRSLAIIYTHNPLVCLFVYVTALQGYWESQFHWIFPPWIRKVLKRRIDLIGKVKCRIDEFKNKYSDFRWLRTLLLDIYHLRLISWHPSVSSRLNVWIIAGLDTACWCASLLRLLRLAAGGDESGPANDAYVEDLLHVGTKHCRIPARPWFLRLWDMYHYWYAVVRKSWSIKKRTRKWLKRKTHTCISANTRLYWQHCSTHPRCKSLCPVSAVCI